MRKVGANHCMDDRVDGRVDDRGEEVGYMYDHTGGAAAGGNREVLREPFELLQHDLLHTKAAVAGSTAAAVPVIAMPVRWGPP